MLLSYIKDFGWKLVNIDKIQYKFMKRKGTVGAVIVLRRLAEKLRSKNKTLFFVFVDLEKTFNYVPRGSFCFA